jgi:DNA-binding MarR family transcriptional regulator
MAIIEQLQQLGFSQYEAQAYIALLQNNPLNGYELAKLSGIPRPNIYAVLGKLEERGAVLRLDTDEGTRYTPVASEELIQRLHHQFQISLEEARKGLEEVKVSPEKEYIWNSRGYPALLEHARSFIDSAERQLYLAVWPQEAKALSERVCLAEERGVRITTLCLGGCSHNCGNCRGDIHQTQSRPESSDRWLLLVPDEREVLAGEVHANDETLAVRTRQRLMVNLAGWYIRQSIALSEILRGFGDHFVHLLDPQTLEILNRLEFYGVPDSIENDLKLDVPDIEQ